MERVCAAAQRRHRPTPHLLGVEMRIHGTEIDYTVRENHVVNAIPIDVDVAVEVKHYGAMRDRPISGGRTLTVADQILQRVRTLTSQVTNSLRDPQYTVVRVEIVATTTLRRPCNQTWRPCSRASLLWP